MNRVYIPIPVKSMSSEIQSSYYNSSNPNRGGKNIPLNNQGSDNHHF